MDLQNVIDVYIEFDLVLNSNKEKLLKELDVLISTGRKVHLWSRTIPENVMYAYCKKTVIPPSKDEVALHEKTRKLRRVDHKTSEEVSKMLDIPLEQVLFYDRIPLSNWTLSDWIAGYRKKEPEFYVKPDMIIDNDEKFVDRFKKRGIPAFYIKEIK